MPTGDRVDKPAGSSLQGVTSCVIVNYYSVLQPYV